MADWKPLLILLFAITCCSIDAQQTAFPEQYADVIFLIVSPETMTTSAFEEVKNLISETVRQLDVGLNKYSIGLAQFSGVGQVEFVLNTYEKKEEILGHIQRITAFAEGSLQTGSILEFLLETFFVDEAGSRLSEGTPQVVVFIAPSGARDDIMEATWELEEMGVKVFPIATESFRGEVQLGAAPPVPTNYPTVSSLLILYLTLLLVCSSATIADIVFLVDESSKIGSKNFQLIRTFLLKVVKALDIGSSNVRVGLVTYSNEPRLEFTLDTFKNKLEILNYLKNLPYRGGQPYTGKAIEFLRKMVFTKGAGSREKQGAQQIAVVITDGQSLDNYIEPASKLRRRGVTVYAVGIQNTTESGKLDKIATYPPNKHVFNLKFFLQLSNIGWKIKKRLCNEIVTKTFVVPSQIQNLKEGCKETEEADIYFLVDGSGSINVSDFKDMKTFMNETIRMFQVGANMVRFGVVQYAETTRTEFVIGQHNSIKALSEAIWNIWQIGGGTQTGNALRFMKSLFKKTVRNNVPQILVVITDGESQDKVAQSAKELREQNIVILAIGVKNAVQRELEEIAGTKDKVFLVNDYNSLMLIKHDIVQDICSMNVCKNLRADIVFLVDSSGSIHPAEFQRVKKFTQSVVSGVEVGLDAVRFGLLQFSSDVREEFQLDRYSSTPALHRAIQEMQQMKGGTLTGKALSFAASYFDRDRGGRPELKQYLIVITDGESQEPVKMPAKAIRDKGIIVYAIDMLRANNSQLVEIAGTQDRVFLENNLEFLNKKILFEICSQENLCKRAEVADIMFAVHVSSGITALQLKSVQRLLEAVVNGSIVGADKVRFGALVYSSKQKVHFSLSSYFSKARIRGAIFNLKPLPGQPLTARALNFARQRFGVSYGGRASSHAVTRILILVTDEPTAPSDRANLPAALRALKEDGINLVAVGMSTASKAEFQEVLGNKEQLLFVQSYDALESIQENLMQIVCEKSKPVCSHQLADLVFLIDGSESISENNFSIMKNFMKEIVDSFIVSKDDVHVGVVQYSQDPQKEFSLKDFYTSTSIKDQIDSIVQLRSSTYTGKGLRFVRSLFEPANGSRIRQGVSQNLIVITDGYSADEVDDAAMALRREGILLFAVGVGTINSFELLRIAGDAKRVFTVESFDALKTIKRHIVEEVCESGDRHTQPGSTLHLKQSLRTFLPRLLLQMTSLPNISCTAGSPPNIRFRFQVLSQTNQIVFDSDFEDYSEEITQKFLDAQTSVNTYLNADMLQAFGEKFFTVTSDKILLIFSDGLDDSLDNLRKHSIIEIYVYFEGLDALLIVGVSNTQNLTELREIEFGRGVGYNEPLSVGFANIASILKRNLDIIAERKCCNVCCKCLGEIGNHGDRGYPGMKVGELRYKLLYCFIFLGIFLFLKSFHIFWQGESGFIGYPGAQVQEWACDCFYGFFFLFFFDHLSYKLLSFINFQGENGDPGVPGIKGSKGVRGRRVNTCPVYPTEVVFALDMSEDVTPAAFERMKNIVLSLLGNIKISESNCPTGARVSVVSYNANTRYLIRFSEFQKSHLLLQAVQRIPLERSTGRRNIGAAMRFVARNVFKRVRQGVLTRKVAVFFANGPSQEGDVINTAVLEFSALDITPVVIAFSEVPNVRRAFSIDDTGRFQLFVWERQQSENLETIVYCTLCYDKCKPNASCEVSIPPPVPVDVDIAYIMDSSSSVGREEFQKAKDFVHNMLDQFVITPQPRESPGGTRVALVQQAPRGFLPGRSQSPVALEFDLVTYSNKDSMKKHIQESVRQLEGPSAVASALQWTVENVFFKAPMQRKHRVIFTILGSQTSKWDRERLREISLGAKCRGFTVFTLALGSGVSDWELTELSSSPVEQHSLSLGRVSTSELAYAQRFSREMNNYPSPELQEECENLDRGDAQQQTSIIER
uniref:VWFA domain-containing protein n=1 Tax=Nothoprocta perdicaria TaxID=30464 RepID=A0A8C7EDV7_NOTPE